MKTCFRCREAGDVTVLVVTREHVHTLSDLPSTNISADVSIMKVHRVKEPIGKLYIDYRVQSIVFFPIMRDATHSFPNVEANNAYRIMQRFNFSIYKAFEKFDYIRGADIALFIYTLLLKDVTRKRGRLRERGTL